MEKNYNKIGNIFSVIVLAVSILILYGFVKGASSLMYLLAIANLICGPICLVMYLIEVKKGVFKTDEKDEEMVEQQ